MYQPINGNRYGKLFVFALLLLVSCLVIVGIIPVLLIAFGTVMFNRTRDFSHLETAARNSRIWCFLLTAGLLYISVMCGTKSEWSSDRDAAVAFFVFSLISLAYARAITKLFLKPLQEHREWIEAHGIFGKKPGDITGNAAQPQVDIIGRQDARTFSVADELLKWAKLKEDGHVTEAEFKEARAQLLNK